MIPTILQNIWNIANKLIQDQALINVVGIIVGILFPVVLQRRQMIAYETVLNAERPADSRYGPTHMIRWKIWNNGNEPVEIKNYTQCPIQITFGSNAKIVEAKILKTKPPSLKGHASLTCPPNSHSAILSAKRAPIPLSKGDSITLHFRVLDAKTVETDISMISTTHGKIDVTKNRKMQFIWACCIIPGLLLAWFIINLKFASLYVLSAPLAFLIVSLGTLCIV